jgi:hypothetical protein
MTIEIKTPTTKPTTLFVAGVAGAALCAMSVATDMPKPKFTNAIASVYLEMKADAPSIVRAQEEQATKFIEEMNLSNEQFDAVWQKGIPVAMWADEDEEM